MTNSLLIVDDEEEVLSTNKTLRSLEMGAVDYTLKPFDKLDTVLALVNESARRVKRWKKSLKETVKLQREKKERLSPLYKAKKGLDQLARNA